MLLFNKKPEKSNFRKFTDEYLSNLSVDAALLLDIGGGRNTISQAKVADWSVKEARTLDISVKYKPDYVADINEDLSSFIKGNNIENKFDAIFCLNIAEYFWNPVQAHRNIFNLLKSSGIAYINYLSIYSIHSPVSIDYARYSRAFILKLLEVSGFKSWEITKKLSTSGRSKLLNFFKAERMQYYPELDETWATGYIVKAFR